MGPFYFYRVRLIRDVTESLDVTILLLEPDPEGAVERAYELVHKGLFDYEDWQMDEGNDWQKSVYVDLPFQEAMPIGETYDYLQGETYDYLQG
jgi:hypothetical protein